MSHAEYSLLNGPRKPDRINKTQLASDTQENTTLLRTFNHDKTKDQVSHRPGCAMSHAEYSLLNGPRKPDRIKKTQLATEIHNNTTLIQTFNNDKTKDQVSHRPGCAMSHAEYSLLNGPRKPDRIKNKLINKGHQ